MPVRPRARQAPPNGDGPRINPPTRADRPFRTLGWYLPRHASADGRVREPTPSDLTRSEQGGEGVSEDSSGRAARRAEEMKGGQRSGGVVASFRLLLHRAGAGGEAFGVFGVASFFGRRNWFQSSRPPTLCSWSLCSSVALLVVTLLQDSEAVGLDARSRLWRSAATTLPESRRDTPFPSFRRQSDGLHVAWLNPRRSARPTRCGTS